MNIHPSDNPWESDPGIDTAVTKELLLGRTKHLLMLTTGYQFPFELERFLGGIITLNNNLTKTNELAAILLETMTPDLVQKRLDTELKKTFSKTERRTNGTEQHWKDLYLAIIKWERKPEDILWDEEEKLSYSQATLERTQQRLQDILDAYEDLLDD